MRQVSKFTLHVSKSHTLLFQIYKFVLERGERIMDKFEQNIQQMAKLTEEVVWDA